MEPPSAGRPAAGRAPREFLTLELDRRRFLIVLGGAAAVAALAPHEAWARKVANTLPPLQPWSLPETAPSDPNDLARVLIGAAVLAPSHWNTQPWRFEAGGNSIRLLADPQRALPVTDPEQRALRLGLGAALENLLVAARAYGLRPTVSYLSAPNARGVAEVSWTEGEQRRDRGLFAAIGDRRTNRRNYDGRGIFPENRAQLQAQVQDGFRLRWLDEPAELKSVAGIAHDAVHAQMLDRRAQEEHFNWMRFGDDDARRHGDGLSVDALELGGPAKWFAGRYFNPRSWFLKYGAGSAAKQTRDAIQSAGAVVLLTAKRRGEESWLIGGQVYERLALKATQLGIAQQPINAPLEVDRYRAELSRRFGIGNEDALMLVRLGHADRPRAVERRAVALVTSFGHS
jgi:nitroreductase